MASLDSLPPDQRAVLQLVLQRGRSYDQIAGMLSIDRAAVRDRALTAFDLIAPDTEVPAARRALITDYLMGQLPPRVAEQVQDRLAGSAAERAWARALASELTPLAREPLPAIPDPADRAATRAMPATGAAGGRASDAGEAVPERPRRRRPTPAPATMAAATEAGSDADDERISPAYGLRDPESPDARQSSRRGGAILIALGVVIAAAIIIVVIAVSGGSSKHPSSPSASNTPSTPSGTTSTPATTPTTGTSTTTQVVGRINLTPPSGGSSPVGQAEIVRQGANEGVVIVGQGLAANTKHNAYAVWLYNSASDSHLLGFVNPAVKADGKLQTAGVLPANASRFKQLLVTVETQGHPTSPGTIVLQGALNLK